MDWKKGLVGECNEDIDLISNLPDAIICHILSFIPTKFSARTRILSKRWKQLFTFVSVLDFYFRPEMCDPCTTRRFLNFVTWVFSSYNVNQMDRCRFCYYYDLYLENPSPLLHFWISESMRRRVRELDVTLYVYPNLALPSCVFTSETLTSLKVEGDFMLEVPDDVCLPNLKTLHLLDVSLNDACSVARLFLSCPVLEVLSFRFYPTENYKQTLNVSVPTLKRLKIDQGINNFDVLLNVPRLECFEYIVCQDNCVVSAVHDFKLLDKACFDFQTYCYGADKVVNMVSHVRHLCFSTSTLKAFERNRSLSTPIFHKVTHLDIRGLSSYYHPLVLDLLDKTPRLEELLVDCDLHLTMDDDDQLLPKDVPTCVSLHLKKVGFLGFSMLKYQCKLVEYFLKNAKHLCTLKIMSKDTVEQQFEMSKKLQTFPKCSTACQIVLKSDMREI